MSHFNISITVKNQNIIQEYFNSYISTLKPKPKQNTKNKKVITKPVHKEFYDKIVIIVNT